MTGTVARIPVAKRKIEPESPPEKINTKVERELLRKARAVADFRDVDLYVYLDAILRDTIEPQYKEMVRSEAKE